MKVLLLHLSDIHFKEDDIIDILKIDKLVQSLSIINTFSKCIILFSGDLTHSGKAKEYDKVRNFLNIISIRIRKKYLPKKFIKVLVVPGNHDIVLNKDDKNRSKNIIEYYHNGTINDYIDSEIGFMKNFYSSRVSIDSFDEVVLINKKKILIDKTYMIQFNLINTAIFSTLDIDDKQFHHLPTYELDKIKKNEGDITISIMHHSTEWFNDLSKDKLDSTIRSLSSILLIGHDHTSCSLYANYDNEQYMFISKGGEYSNDDTKATSFNALILDTENNTLDSFTFTWNIERSIFIHKNTYKNQKIVSKNNMISPTNDYINSIKDNTKRTFHNCDSFLDYFIFPTLLEDISNKNNFEKKNELRIKNIEEFRKLLFDKRYIVIKGHELYGKTTLIKSLYLDLSNDFITVFFSNEEITRRRPDRIIKSQVEEQYGDDSYFYEEFLQSDINKKIAIIDDFDKIKENEVKEVFINEIFKNFGFIIITNSFSQTITIEKMAKEVIEFSEDFFILSIQPFYKLNRLALIKKLCVLSGINAKQITTFTDAIDKFIEDNLNLLELNPDFIIEYVTYFIEKQDPTNLLREDTFGLIFENNIDNAIISCGNKENASLIKTVLSKIAHHMHFNKKAILSYEEIDSVIEKYNTDYNQKPKILTKHFLNTAIKTKILCELPYKLEYKFSNRNYLAFFVAKALLMNFARNPDYREILQIMNNICFGINSSIIMFLTYISDNITIINKICELSIDLMKDWPEHDFDKNNIKYLSNNKINPPITPPHKGDRSKLDAAKDKREESTYSISKLECVGIYDYDESSVNDFSNQILKALKYTELLCKALPSFNDNLLTDEKENLLASIYSNPNKIIYKILKPLDDSFEELAEELIEYSEEKRGDEELTLKELEILLIQISNILIIQIFDMLSCFTVDSRSIEDLNSFDIKNSNYKLFNAFIEHNHTYTKLNRLVSLLEEIYTNSNYNIRRIVCHIVKKHITYNNIPDNIRQSLVDKFFNGNQKDYFIESKKSK